MPGRRPRGLPVRPLARRARPARAAVRPRATPSTRSATRCSAGSGVREALRELLRRGTEGRRGLDELRRSVRERLRQARTAGRMDGTLQEVRELLDKALDAERRELFPDPDDSARLAEAELDALPDDTAGAVRALKEYPWRSAEAPAGLRADPGPAAPRGARQLRSPR